MPNAKRRIRLSQKDKILVSMYRVSKGTKGKIPWEELVIQAWKEFPESFSLRNHPEYPEGNNIVKRMSDKLKPQGFVVGLGNNMFRLSDKGLEVARRLVDSLEGREVINNSFIKQLSREEETYYRHAISSQAFLQWVDGNKGSLIDYDAKLFFKFSTGTKVEERINKMNFAKSTIKKAMELGFPEADELHKLFGFLKEEFRELFSGGNNE